MIVPKAVVFDLGKVLLDFDYGRAVRKFSEKCDKTAAQLTSFLIETPLLLRYECGILNKHEFYEGFCNGTGYCGSMSEFARHFSDIFCPINEMLELHAQLRSHSVPTYIFSNTNDLAVEHIRRQFPFFHTFEGYVLSYEHGFMKPDPRLYDVVEAVTGRRGPEIVYIDDRTENIESGQARQWETILHECPKQTRKQIEHRGLLK